MNEPASKAVLITGCSSGIGHATAERFVRRGWTTYATARRPETLDALAEAGCRTLRLDVTDEASMRAVVDEIEREHGAVGVLVNNAGYGQEGAVESVAIDDVRRQFETNVFGALRLTQLALPAMRERRSGRIVNVSSMGGKVTFPGGGVYHASKFALEALSDVLRWEVAPWGVDVIVIEPGLIRTGFGEVASNAAASAGVDGAYAAFNAQIATTVAESYTRPPLAWTAVGPERVAKVIERAASARRPRPRYVVPRSTRGMLLMRRLLPDRVYDLMLRAVFRPPVPSR